MTKSPTKKLVFYTQLLDGIKTRIRSGQTRAVLSANAEMIRMYWDIGQLLVERQSQSGWGGQVIPQLSKDIRNELPEVKGFSERNMGRMIAFYRAYPSFESILPQPVAKLTEGIVNIISKIPWGHHFLLLEKVKSIEARFWYMQQTLEQGWGRDVLSAMIKSDVRTFLIL